MKFEFNWLRGFRGMLTDGRGTDAEVTGILIAQLGAFGLGELKSKHFSPWPHLSGQSFV